MSNAPKKPARPKIWAEKKYWPSDPFAVPNKLKPLVGQMIKGKWYILRWDRLGYGFRRPVWGLVEMNTHLTILEKDLL